jgi:predicted dehydrogenase
MAKAELRVGVIGAGGHAQGHFAMIAAEPRMRLVAVAEVDPARLEKARAQHAPERCFGDYRAMLDEVELDMVYVVTMPGHLLPIVTECLARGIHTSVEKSPGMTSTETRTMAEAARNSRGKAIVSFNRRYFPEVLAARTLLRAHGGPIHVAAVYHKTPWALTGGPWQTLAPAPIICDAIHHVDLVRWLAGASPHEAARVAAVSAHTRVGRESGTFQYNGTIRFEDGCLGVMSSQYGVGYRIQRAEAHAAGLSVYLELTRKPEVTVYENGRLRETPLDLDPVGGPAFNETTHFADCILNDTTPWSHLDDAIETMTLAEALNEGRGGA